MFKSVPLFTAKRKQLVDERLNHIDYRVVRKWFKLRNVIFENAYGPKLLPIPSGKVLCVTPFYNFSIIFRQATQ